MRARFVWCTNQVARQPHGRDHADQEPNQSPTNTDHCGIKMTFPENNDWPMPLITGPPDGKLLFTPSLIQHIGLLIIELINILIGWWYFIRFPKSVQSYSPWHHHVSDQGMKVLYKFQNSSLPRTRRLFKQNTCLHQISSDSWITCSMFRWVMRSILSQATGVFSYTVLPLRMM